MDTSHGLELFIDPDNRTLKAKAPKRLSVTTLDKWTNTFGTYMSIIVSCFPFRATELIAYMNIMREAAADFPSLCFLMDVVTAPAPVLQLSRPRVPVV